MNIIAGHLVEPNSQAYAPVAICNPPGGDSEDLSEGCQDGPEASCKAAAAHEDGPNISDSETLIPGEGSGVSDAVPGTPQGPDDHLKPGEWDRLGQLVGNVTDFLLDNGKQLSTSSRQASVNIEQCLQPIISFYRSYHSQYQTFENEVHMIGAEQGQGISQGLIQSRNAEPVNVSGQGQANDVSLVQDGEPSSRAGVLKWAKADAMPDGVDNQEVLPKLHVDSRPVDSSRIQEGLVNAIDMLAEAHEEKVFARAKRVIDHYGSQERGDPVFLYSKQKRTHDAVLESDLEELETNLQDTLDLYHTVRASAELRAGGYMKRRKIIGSYRSN
ncbi:hypothetical protein B0O80DRAFT_496943 [Mortierella sp. GBAus27b]|nr:hypothetical protein BGX31_003345 [Mortierella sp. GBA43]KAI8356229.1 hypothetical protein B0O80DRAFT_496943 [Mortierella sp. GBAus27b]